ncbi:BTAD domain-containing putative transcriptional regulator [Micromonospora sp. WMMD558]|uniref:AfsR/SARP family transcriptional regulator n=1 Tax=unclassified Micromonospora TaxID=2617518 RepID=UPI0012B4D895|nr:AfsR/SARP family transcriptional regulator [Micromonospora sp. WMMC415]QGN46737.1 transcriptional regulator [Micromonospora sp. WMMC415]
MSGALRFALLGPQRAWYADRELDLGPSKRRAVLAVLLLAAGRPVSTTQIVDAVWPDDPPANGPNVVQKYVAGLRRILEPERSPRTPGQVLALTDAGYVLHVSPDSLDAVRFEQAVRRAERHREAGRPTDALAELSAALELWRGEPFTGFAGPFFEAARQRYVELRATALESWAELELDQGRHRELVGPLVELAGEFPVRERLRRQLMLALYRSGRQAEALAAYRDFDELLRDGYGIEPGEQLRELHRRVLSADPALLPAPDPGPVAADAPAPPAETVAAPPAATAPAEPPARNAPPAPPPASAAIPSGTGPAPPLPGYGPPGLLPPPPILPPRRRRWPAEPAPRWLANLATTLGTLLVLVSLGFITWLIVFVYAVWRQSGRLALAGVGYLVVLVGFIVVLENMNPDPEAELTDFEGFYILGFLLSCWAAGALHVVLLNRRVWALVTGGSRAGRAAEKRRLRREHARLLLHYHPAARDELRIGRPDLPRTFDDGGLIDVNSVSEAVLADLPGLTTDQCRQVAVDRWLRGPYGSVEELAGRCMLPPASTERLRDVLLFLPPNPAQHQPAAP